MHQVGDGGRESSAGKKCLPGLRLLVLLVCWTACIGLSLAHNLSQIEEKTVAAAVIQAKTAFDKDLMFWRWNSFSGGVAVPVIRGVVEPNLYFVEESRDIRTEDGTVLTKVNPAYMIRLVHEQGELRSGLRSRITSLKPIRPRNAPDPWERHALQVLETKKVAEVAEVQVVDGQPYLRFMGGLETVDSCLPCHSFQGYRTGEVRGGVSVTVSMQPFQLARQSLQQSLYLTHAGLFVVGLLALFAGFRLLRRRSG